MAILKKVGNDWIEVPEALQDNKDYTELKDLEVMSSRGGYVGQVELIYATHREVFDSLSPSSLREKNFEYIVLKQQESELKKRIDLLKNEIINLHSALDNKADALDGGSAGTIEFKETKKVSYDDKAIAKIKELINANGGIDKDGKAIVEDKINEKQLQAFQKTHPELSQQIEALKTYKTDIRMAIKANPDFVMPERDALDEMFREDREKAHSERYRTFCEVYELAEKYENKTIKMSEAEVFKAQMEILKTEYSNARKNEVLKDVLENVSKSDIPDKGDMEMC